VFCDHGALHALLCFFLGSHAGWVQFFWEELVLFAYATFSLVMSM